jgi:hypothetical protein
MAISWMSTFLEMVLTALGVRSAMNQELQGICPREIVDLRLAVGRSCSVCTGDKIREHDFTKSIDKRRQSLK